MIKKFAYPGLKKQILDLKLRLTAIVTVFFMELLANGTYGLIRTQSRSMRINGFGQTHGSRIHHRPSKKAYLMMFKSSYMTPHYDKTVGHQSQNYINSRLIFDFWIYANFKTRRLKYCRPWKDRCCEIISHNLKATYARPIPPPQSLINKILYLVTNL